MNTKVAITIVVIGLIIIGGWFFLLRQPSVEEGGGTVQEEQGVLDKEAPIPVSAEDTTEAIDADIKGIDLGDIEEGFKDIDSELNSL